MSAPKVGHYIRWWEMDESGFKKSYAGTVVKERLGWHCYYIVDCIDGKQRKFVLSASYKKDGTINYEPEYINFTEPNG